MVTVCTTNTEINKFCILPTEEMFGFYTILRISSDYFPK
jgi:hypothetical protein